MSTGVVPLGDRGSAARALLTALYPPPLRVDDAGAPVAAGPARATWSALPSAANPRLLVPAGGAAVATRSVRRQLSGRRWRTRVARAGLTVVAGTGALPHVPGVRLSVTGPADAASIEDPLREVLGVDDLRLTLPVGPARATRKPVLQVTDRAGRVLAFVKVGHQPLTRQLVRQEAATLRMLDDETPRGVRVPRALALLPWGGSDVLVLEPLAIPARRLAGVAARQRLLRLVGELASVGGRARVDWDRHPYRDALLTRLDDCAGLAEPLLHELDRTTFRRPLETGAWHGDLNPGNVAVVGGACPVWDWERFEHAVPVGFDLLHHDLHEAVTVRGVAPAAAAVRTLRDAGALLPPLGVDPVDATSVARLYLVAIAARYVGDAQHAAGSALGRVEDWVLPALAEDPA